MTTLNQGPTGRVFSILGGFGSGIEKNFGYRAGSGRVGVLNYLIRYFGYFGYFGLFQLAEAICNRGFEEEDEGERRKADTACMDSS